MVLIFQTFRIINNVIFEHSNNVYEYNNIIFITFNVKRYKIKLVYSFMRVVALQKKNEIATTRTKTHFVRVVA